MLSSSVPPKWLLGKRVLFQNLPHPHLQPSGLRTEGFSIIFHLIAWDGWVKRTIVILGLFSLSVVPPKKGDVGVGFAAPAEGPVRFGCIFPGNSKDPWFPPVPVGCVRNRGHLLSNARWSQQYQSPWFSKYVLPGYAFQLSPKCSLSLWEWRLQRQVWQLRRVIFQLGLQTVGLKRIRAVSDTGSSSCVGERCRTVRCSHVSSALGGGRRWHCIWKWVRLLRESCLHLIEQWRGELGVCTLLKVVAASPWDFYQSQL